jgi:hypothetical protein
LFVLQLLAEIFLSGKRLSFQLKRLSLWKHDTINLYCK